MKITKLVFGILMIILSVFIVFQSTAMGFLNTFSNKGSHSGTGGMIMAVAYLAAGIVYIATKNQIKLGGDIANAVILVLFGLVALTSADKTFQDLIVWIVLGFIIGLGFLIWHILINKKSQSNNHPTNYNQINNSTNYPSRAQYRRNKKY